MLHSTGTMRRVAFVVTLFVVLIHVASSATHARESVRQGVLDLTHAAHERGVIPLSGEWAFYWGELLEPDDFAGQHPPVPTGFVRIPASWNGMQVDGAPLPGDGFATYRMRIRLSTSDGPLALYIPYQQTAYRLWVDGALLATNGSVASSPGDFSPEYLSTIARFTPTAGDVEIILQIANFAHREGGMWNSPVLGTVSHIERMVAGKLTAKMLLVGGFLIIAFYHIVLYTLRRATQAPLFLGVLSLCIAVRTMIMGDHFLGWVVSVPWEWQVRIEYFAGYAAMAAFALFLHATFPLEARAPITRAAVVFGLGAAILGLVLPVSLTSRFVPMTLVIMAAMVVYFVLVSIVAFGRQRPGSQVLMVGGSILGVTVLLDFFGYTRILAWGYFKPLGYLALLLSQAVIHAQEFARALRLERTLVQQLKESRQLLTEHDESERRAVSEFLHSHVQSRMTLVMHKLKEANAAVGHDPDKAKELLKEAHDDVDRVREEDIRQASHLLHPTVIDFGIGAAVRAVASQYAGELQVTVHVDPDVKTADEALLFGDDPSEQGFAQSVRLTAYRIVEECLGNISKHAHAKAVRIEVGLSQSQERGRGLSITVADDGVGFDADSAEWGLGLKVIAARAHALDGRLEIESRPGAGTTLRAFLPL